MNHRALSIFLLSSFCCFSGNSESIFKIDFTTEPNGPGITWLEKNNFKYQNNGEDLNTYIKNGRFYIEADRELNGLIIKEKNLAGVKKVRILWGVTKFPEGANWNKNVKREAIAIVLSFGKKKISSDSWYIPDVPYFISLFLGQNENENQAYKGNYFQKGGRYFCVPCKSQINQSVSTEIDIEQLFKKTFKKDTMPAITSFSFEVDTRDTKGTSGAFIEQIEFLR